MNIIHYYNTSYNVLLTYYLCTDCVTIDRDVIRYLAKCLQVNVQSKFRLQLVRQQAE